MSMTRKELTFASDGDKCAAWFYPAAADTGARPVVVMAHGLTGTRRDRFNAFADRFAAAGIAALVFDYRGFGDSTGEPDFYEPSRQLDDWRAAIAFARSLPDIDPGRVATFGSSSGGGHALAAAAADPMVAAAISQVPMLDRDTQAYKRPQRVVEEIKAAAAEGRYLPAVGQPDEAALIYAPGAEVGWRRVVAIGDESRWRNRVWPAWGGGVDFRAGGGGRLARCRGDRRRIRVAEPSIDGLASGAAISADSTCRLASLPLAGLCWCGRSGCEAGASN